MVYPVAMTMVQLAMPASDGKEPETGTAWSLCSFTTNKRVNK
jgi:hypothetical protein